LGPEVNLQAGVQAARPPGAEFDPRRILFVQEFIGKARVLTIARITECHQLLALICPVEGLSSQVALIALGAFAPAAQAAPKGDSIVDVALAVNAQTGEFSILIAALQAADPKVIKKLDGKGQFTVFAPTDAAFVSLLKELGLTADQLLSNKKLVTQVLLYHVARGNRDSEQVLSSKRIRTLEGGFLFQNDGVLTDANGRTANIIAVDIKASNGVIHVIDRVVLP
jgi:uncharacterized surface protein with fasciclin (FAS1) repeats